MNVENIEQKAKAYDEALEKAKKILDSYRSRGLNDVLNYVKEDMKKLFPELKANENEKIKESIKKILANTDFKKLGIEYSFYDMINWLEADKEKKDLKHVDPEFKLGDWICNNLYSLHITAINDGKYYFNSGDGYSYGDIKFINDNYHLWTIKDAKPGDILCGTVFNNDPNSFSTERISTERTIFIFKEITTKYENEKYFANKAILTSYCYIISNSNENRFGFDVSFQGAIDFNTIKPATKKFCSYFLQKIKENGYKFDFDKKELYPIENDEVDVQNNQAEENLREWDDNDEINFRKVINSLESDRYCDGATGEMIYPRQKETEWLKSLKDRICGLKNQKKCE